MLVGGAGGPGRLLNSPPRYPLDLDALLLIPSSHCIADTRTSGGQQHWCRPLSGCAAPELDASVPAASPSAAQQPLPPVVALGKFDALHRGHRALAAAAAALGGAPWMVSFSGMAEVLGWPARLPLVAPCDRQRVLDSWAAHCRGRQPRECEIPFSEVRGRGVQDDAEALRPGYRGSCWQQAGTERHRRFGLLLLCCLPRVTAALSREHPTPLCWRAQTR